MVAGGSGSNNNTIEYLTSTGWKVSPTKLPAYSYQGCAAPINTTHYIILEGRNDNNVESNRVFFFNLATGSLTLGPNRLVARSGFSCATGRFGNTTAVVIAGGRNGLTYYNTSEYLDLSVGSWSKASGELY